MKSQKTDKLGYIPPLIEQKKALKDWLNVTKRLKEQKEEIKRKVEGMKDTWQPSKDKSGMNWSDEARLSESYRGQYKRGYNQAIDDIISDIINILKGEI